MYVLPESKVTMQNQYFHLIGNEKVGFYKQMTGQIYFSCAMWTHYQKYVNTS